MNELIEGIRALSVRTKSGRLRALMPLIEDRLADGVRQQDIITALREGGIDLTPGTFKSYLHRHRVKQRNHPTSPPQLKSEPPRSQQDRPHTDLSVNADRTPSVAVGLDAESTYLIPNQLTLADILDKKSSDALTDQYMNRRRPLIGRNREKP